MSESTAILNKALVEKLRKGDRATVKQLYRTAYPYCAAFVRSNNGTAIDAEDMFQESLLILYKNIRREDFQLTCNIKTYLYSVVRKLWLKQLVKRNKNGLNLVIDEGKFTPDWIPISDREVEEKMALEKKYRLISELLEQVKEDCRRLLKAYYHRRLSLKEIASELGYTRDFVKVKKFRCMEALKKLIKKNM